MTQAELWQLQLMATANTTQAFQGVLTILCAFLATACFVGLRSTAGRPPGEPQ